MAGSVKLLRPVVDTCATAAAVDCKLVPLDESCHTFARSYQINL